MKNSNETRVLYRLAEKYMGYYEYLIYPKNKKKRYEDYFSDEAFCLLNKIIQIKR